MVMIFVPSGNAWRSEAFSELAARFNSVIILAWKKCLSVIKNIHIYIIKR